MDSWHLKPAQQCAPACGWQERCRHEWLPADPAQGPCEQSAELPYGLELAQLQQPQPQGVRGQSALLVYAAAPSQRWPHMLSAQPAQIQRLSADGVAAMLKQTAPAEQACSTSQWWKGLLVRPMSKQAMLSMQHLPTELPWLAHKLTWLHSCRSATHL